VLRRWVERQRNGTWRVARDKPLKTDVVAELERVKPELAKVRMERDIIRKERRSPTARRTRREVRIHCQTSPRMTNAYDVPGSRSLGERLLLLRVAGSAASVRAQDNARLTIRIREYFTLSNGTYGSPRIWRDRVKAGASVKGARFELFFCGSIEPGRFNYPRR
jgi:hypothetical protein